MSSVIASLGWSFADVLRGIAVGLGLFLAGWAIALIIEAREYGITPPLAWYIATSLLFDAAVVVEMASYFGQPLTWRLPITLTANGVGCATMVYAWLYYRPWRRQLRHGEKSRNAACTLVGTMVMRQIEARARGEIDEPELHGKVLALVERMKGAVIKEINEDAPTVGR